MAWKPTTNFDEELVNFKPDQDIMFGFLMEPDSAPFYPRPESHIKQAMLLSKQQQGELKDNGVLRVISAVQQIAGTKPWGELPSVTDWDSTANLEAETVALMRHFGMGPSLDGRLDPNNTIATYPIENNMHLINRKNCKKFPFLNEEFFKLKPKCTPPTTVFDTKSTEDSLETTSSSQENESKTMGTGKIRKKKYISQSNRIHHYTKLKEEEDSLEDEQMLSSSSSSNGGSLKKVHGAARREIVKNKSQNYLIARSKALAREPYVPPQFGSRGEWKSSSNTSLNSSASSTTPLLPISKPKIAANAIATTTLVIKTELPAAAASSTASAAIEQITISGTTETTNTTTTTTETAAIDALLAAKVKQFSKLSLSGKDPVLPQAN